MNGTIWASVGLLAVGAALMWACCWRPMRAMRPHKAGAATDEVARLRAQVAELQRTVGRRLEGDGAGTVGEEPKKGCCNH